MNRKVKRIAVVSYLGLVGALGATTVIAGRIVGDASGPGLTRALNDEAPPFALRDLDDAEVTLDTLRGEDHANIVVLEWFDPGCEWVRTYHASASTVRDLRDEFRDSGVHWAAVYSSTPPEGRDPAELNRAAADRWGIDYPILLDNDRAVATLYKVTQAPTVVVINADGKIIYRGLIDNATDPAKAGSENLLRNAIQAALRAETPDVASSNGPGCHLQAPAQIERN